MRSDRIWWGVVLLGAIFGAAAGPRRAEAQVAYQPTVGTIPDGIGLNVVPAVSADRRYVRVSVDANFQTVNGFQTVGIPFAVSGLGSGSNAAAGLGLAGGAGGAAGGAGGFRSVGVPMGMDGPVTGNGFMAGNPAPGWSGATGEAYAMDDGSWFVPPRRAKSSRVKSPRASQATRRPATATTPPAPKPGTPQGKSSGR